MKKGFAVFLSFLLLFLGIPMQKAAALGDYTITLKVAPNAENEVTYLNGAVYDVFLKYKLDDSGNYIDPHGGGLVDFPLERGKVAPGFFDHAKKVGTVTINGADNPVVMEEDGTKNVRGSYIIRPVKRAPGYHLDRHPDGKYAEVEFPLIENGKEALVQTAEVTLKAERIQVKDSDLLKVEMPKPNPEVNDPLNGISFSLHRLAAPKTIGANNEVTDWELLPENAGSGGRSGRSLASRKPYYEDFLESVDGKLTIPTGKEPLKEGKYYLLIRNMGSHANKVTQINQGIYFTVSEDYGIAGHPEGKIVFESTSENDNSSYVKVIGDDATFGLRTKKKMDSSPITLMLPPLFLPKKAVILPNKTSVEKAFIGNEDTPYLYEISVDVPKDYPFYKSLEIKDGEVAVNKNIRPLFKKEKAAVSGEIKDLSSYTGEYDNISDPIFSKFQVFCQLPTTFRWWACNCPVVRTTYVSDLSLNRYCYLKWRYIIGWLTTPFAAKFTLLQLYSVLGYPQDSLFPYDTD